MFYRYKCRDSIYMILSDQNTKYMLQLIKVSNLKVFIKCILERDYLQVL